MQNRRAAVKPHPSLAVSRLWAAPVQKGAHSHWNTSPVQSARVKVNLLRCMVQHSKSLAVSLVGRAGRDRFLLSEGRRLE